MLLVGVGLFTLWTSRKGGRLVRRYARRAALALAFLVAPPFVIYPLSESYVITHSARAYVPPPQLGTAFEEVSFTTSDGLRLQGWYVPSKNGATVISFPGRKGSQKPARLLAQHGYGVLLFDRRGEGESEGDPNTLGWRGTRGSEAAIAYLKSRPEVDPNRIGGVGLSVGGEVMLQAAAETDDFKAVVSEGAGVRSVREAVHLDGAEKVVFLLVFGMRTIGTAVFTSDLPPRGLIDLSAEITEPVLFIHATPDRAARRSPSSYYEAAKGPKEYWAAPGGHTGAIDAAPGGVRAAGGGLLRSNDRRSAMTSLSHPVSESRETAVARAAAALRTEVGVARVALGVIGLHIVDDNFLQPEPGTSAADHLVSGLVPLALVAAAAAAYGRLRAGVRAVLALLFGFFGLLGGAEAAYYAQDVGVSGDDFTGFLSIAAGLVLLGGRRGHPVAIPPKG